MTIKHIRWVACIGLLAIICLQYVWLVNTYKLTKESIQFRSNEVFRDATMREVFYRMEVYQDSLQKKYKDKDTSIMVRINLDEDYDFFEDGRGDKNVNQWLMSNMQVSMQEIVKRDYKLSVSLSSLDSIYRTGLAAEGLDAEVITCVTDSLGNILRSSRSIQVGDYGLLKTGLQPINYKCTENLQAFIVNTGFMFPFFSPFLGWLGVFLTGSDTSSNALFCGLQQQTAQQLGLNETLMVAANTTGGVCGKMISPQSIAIACASTGIVGKESDLFRFTVKHSLILVVIMGIITRTQAYVLTWMIP